ncbi:MAG TPA: hypothetical protein VFC72_00305 [Corynebacterium sp.]|nr:hypothetical protein [Corynebacterium sp.]
MPNLSSDRAGIFTGDHGGRWVWDGPELRDGAGESLALVRADVIVTGGQQRLLVEYSPGPLHFRVRATTSEGHVYRVTQPGMTVSRLLGDCDGRKYRLTRTSFFRKERALETAAGKITAYVRPLLTGDVEVRDGPDAEAMPFLDAVFLTWACVLVDSPVRRTMI